MLQIFTEILQPILLFIQKEKNIAWFMWGRTNFFSFEEGNKSCTCLKNVLRTDWHNFYKFWKSVYFSFMFIAEVRGSCFFLRLRRSLISFAEPANSIPSMTTGDFVSFAPPVDDDDDTTVVLCNTQTNRMTLFDQPCFLLFGDAADAWGVKWWQVPVTMPPNTNFLTFHLLVFKSGDECLELRSRNVSIHRNTT